MFLTVRTKIAFIENRNAQCVLMQIFDLKLHRSVPDWTIRA